VGSQRVFHQRLAAGGFPQNARARGVEFGKPLCCPVCAVVAVTGQRGKNFGGACGRVEEIQALKRQTAKLITSMSKEKQFNRKVALNRNLRMLQEQITGLSASVREREILRDAGR